jgi:hypothetical protein
MHFEVVSFGVATSPVLATSNLVIDSTPRHLQSLGQQLVRLKYTPATPVILDTI